MNYCNILRARQLKYAGTRAHTYKYTAHAVTQTAGSWWLLLLSRSVLSAGTLQTNRTAAAAAAGGNGYMYTKVVRIGTTTATAATDAGALRAP